MCSTEKKSLVDLASGADAMNISEKKWVISNTGISTSKKFTPKF